MRSPALQPLDLLLLAGGSDLGHALDAAAAAAALLRLHVVAVVLPVQARALPRHAEPLRGGAVGLHLRHLGPTLRRMREPRRRRPRRAPPAGRARLGRRPRRWDRRAPTARRPARPWRAASPGLPSTPCWARSPCSCWPPPA